MLLKITGRSAAGAKDLCQGTIPLSTFSIERGRPTWVGASTVPNNASVDESALTFSDDPPWAEEAAVQAQVREALVLLEALVKSPEHWRHGGMAEPEGSGGKDVRGRRVRRRVVTPVGPNVTFKGLGAEDFRDVISHGDDLQDGAIKNLIGSSFLG